MAAGQKGILFELDGLCELARFQETEPQGW
jgi:hypothetical protein